MSALFIVLEREIPDFDHYVNGHALSETERVLERVATKLSVTPLMEFFGQSPDDVAAFLEEHDTDPAAIEIPDQSWFEAREGLKTIDAISDHLTKNPAVIPMADRLLSELGEWQRVLKRAADEDIRWHLEVDF